MSRSDHVGRVSAVVGPAFVQLSFGSCFVYFQLCPRVLLCGDMASAQQQEAKVVEPLAEAAKTEEKEVTESPEATGNELSCNMCRRNFPKAAPGRAKGKQWSCRHCLSLQTMLYRNMGPMQHQDWTEDSKANFFRRAAAKELAGAKWETVRTLLTDCLTVQHLEERGAEVNAESLPLSVWITKGYEAEAVKQFPAEKCPKLGQLYAIPVRTDTWKDVHRKLTEEVLSKELAVKKQKGCKRPREDDPWDIIPLQAPAAAAQSNKKEKTEKAVDPEKQKAREASKADKSNQVQGALASKSIPILMRVCQGCEATLAKARTLSGLDADDVTAVEEALKKCSLGCRLRLISCISWTKPKEFLCARFPSLYRTCKRIPRLLSRF